MVISDNADIYGTLADLEGRQAPMAQEVDVGKTRAPRPKKDAAREDRIIMQIVVDAYDASERAVGWHSYLESTLQFPFSARCIKKRQISPLQVGDKVDVIGMPDFEECRGEMFVTIRWKSSTLAVPLSQLKPSSRTDEETREAVADWLYWTEMGYEF